MHSKRHTSWIPQILVLCSLLAGPRTIEVSHAQSVKEPATGGAEIDLQQELGSLQSLEAWIGRSVVDPHDEQLGTVADAIIDPYSATVVSLLIDPVASFDSQRPLILPLPLVLPIQAGPIRARQVSMIRAENAPTLADRAAAEPYSRTMAKVPFDYYRVSPTWSSGVFSSKEFERVTAEPVRSNDVLPFWSLLKQQQIPLAGGDSHVKVVDLVVSTETPRIAYLMVRQSDLADSRSAELSTYAIPLCLFQLGSPEFQWTLLLPPSKLQWARVVEPDSLTTKLDPRLRRFVAEQISGTWLGGVQRAKGGE